MLDVASTLIELTPFQTAVPCLLPGGVRRLGVRIGNWLTAEESRRLLSGAGNARPRERRYLRHAGSPHRLWSAPGRSGRIENGGPTTPGGTLGYCRPQRQGRTHSNRTSAGLCQGGDRPLGDPGVRHLWGVVSIDQQGRPCLGRRLHAKSNLVHYQAGSVKLLSFSRNAHDLRRTGARLCHQAGGELEQV